ncbi:hypothetical protein BZG36_00960 [Bifiguratus adelaidae]|uniref:D-arabinitol 2-dehydrogenase [ribulose-forming] n=1 Tax=Bifiguratus adelaidae TaxID=1938954 RepID=A0A261Y6M3_9FUNG|nr:hypothetical protein BZG36_00960 [Bifiguratus adelaidae]
MEILPKGLQSFCLRGKVAAVTGGSRGIGLAVVKALAAAGADVAITYVSSDATHETARQVSQEFGVKCLAYKAEITDHVAIAGALNAIAKDYGKLDILVANAGISANGNTEDFDPDLFKRIHDVNVNGVFFTIQAGAKIMLKQGGGNIITMSSISASIVNRPQFQAAYNSSKAAVSMLTKCVATEWATRGVRVNAVCPGYVLTDMTNEFISKNEAMGKQWQELTPLKRFGTPEEIGGAVVWLASDASSYVVGAEITVDGGYSCW